MGFESTAVRLHNQAKVTCADDMTVSMKDEASDARSKGSSSDGSLTRRNLKSAKTL